MPWALEMARWCLDFSTGKMIQWPRAGGWHEQWQFELDALDLAWQVWRLWTADKWSNIPGAANLALWMDEESPADVYDPSYLSRIDLEK